MSKYSLHAAAALLLLGSADVQASVVHVVVPATQPWVDSGVSLNPGDVVSIRAVGSWKYNGDPNQPANGPDGVPIPLDVGNRNAGALISMVGANPSFVVGEDFDFVTPSSWSGTLQFMINDGIPNLVDNSGALAVLVVVGDPVVSVSDELPGVESSLSIFPNPSEDAVTVWLSLSDPAPVDLTIHDVAGRLVRTLMKGQQLAGKRAIVWDMRTQTGALVPQGIYFVSLRKGDGVITKTLVHVQ